MIARTWLRDYLKRNRRTMSAVQIKAVATMHAPAQSEKPIYMVGATTAEYVLSILP